MGLRKGKKYASTETMQTGQSETACIIPVIRQCVELCELELSGYPLG